ncbi:hypothetical protein SAMD00019534_097170 [Acytostelium subglobosum LB1]|uniref:hypothetical protein n=1 Tax=Acytostelium subglobosum LB1 TaxID=1410327 RepID=UPI000645124C|nr:hypothetical protein SAMD00019534_097170 [Acytostelium subglobosum LB1]GAM26542.1 hypothetical protein SAMD00019534_097170 [Acytostelium subglobosum LB1]|eukprot:XP_012750638.1 hypothetical protein SAMD00019534_097170 [Acytostelium subglobosum LB1]
MDITLALLDLWRSQLDDEKIPSHRYFGTEEHTFPFLATPEHINTLLNETENDDHKRNLVINKYIRLLEYSVDIMPMLIQLFGWEAISLHMDQWFMIPLDPRFEGYLSHSEQKEMVGFTVNRIIYLNSIPNKAASKLLQENKQYILKFYQRHLLKSVDRISPQRLSGVLSVVLNDPENKEANQVVLIDLLTSLINSTSNHWPDTWFEHLHQFIEPIEQCLQFFHRLDHQSINTLITLIGPPFLKYYQLCEEKLLDKLYSMSINATSFNSLAKPNVHGHKQPDISNKELAEIIDGLIDLNCIVVQDQVGKSTDFTDAVLAALTKVTDYPTLTKIIEQHRNILLRFVQERGDSVLGQPPYNNQFAQVITRLK